MAMNGRGVVHGNSAERQRWLVLFWKRANVFADSRTYFDIKTRLGGDIKHLTRSEGLRGGLSVQFDRAGSGHNFHPLGGVRAKMKLPRENEAQRLFASIRK